MKRCYPAHIKISNEAVVWCWLSSRQQNDETEHRAKRQFSYGTEVEWGSRWHSWVKCPGVSHSPSQKDEIDLHLPAFTNSKFQIDVGRNSLTIEKGDYLGGSKEKYFKNSPHKSLATKKTPKGTKKLNHKHLTTFK